MDFSKNDITFYSKDIERNFQINLKKRGKSTDEISDEGLNTEKNLG